MPTGKRKSSSTEADAGRRAWLRGVGALALAAPGLGEASADAAGGAPGGSRRAARLTAASLQRADVDVQLRTFMRLFTSNGGECALAYQGTLYGRAPGELPRPLIAFRTVLTLRAREVEPGVFRTEQREAYHYADLGSGEVVRSFRNPYTDEDVIPIGYVSPNNIYWFDDTGSYARDRPAERIGRFTVDWREDDAELWVTESRYNRFPTSITEQEFPRAYAGPWRDSVDVLTYRALHADVANARLHAVPTRTTMISETPWPLWMMMAKRPGNVVLQGFGRKYAKLTDLPRWLIAATEAQYPGFIEAPWEFSSHDSGTAAQLRRLRAEGKL